MVTSYAIDHEQALKILQSEGVKERIGLVNEIKCGYCYLVNHRMLLVLIPHTERAIEAHIAEPKAYLSHIHEDIETAKELIQLKGYSEIWTNVTSHFKTTINLLTKHGFDTIDEINNEVLMLWVSQQQ